MTDVDNLPTAKSLGKAGASEDSSSVKKQKLPGSDRKRTEGRHTPVVKRDVPESLQKEQDSDMDELTRTMNEFVMQQIGENLARTAERDQKDAAAAARKASSAMSPQSSKFKPKAPVKRYAERHPELSAMQTDTAPTMPTAEDYESLSDDEYVIETYVRVAAESLGKDLDPERVGLLVFDNEPDVDFFFGEEGDSDDEWPEDDEDENGRPRTQLLTQKARQKLTLLTLS
jgi:DNA primase